MKTSNKLLLTFFLALICSSFISILIARQNMAITKQHHLVGNKNIVKKKVVSTLHCDTLIFTDHFEYVLDSTSDAILIEAEENIIPAMTIENDGEFKVNFGDSRNVMAHTNARIFIGIKSKKSLTLIADSNTRISSSSGLQVENLSIEAGDNSTFDLDIQVNSLILDIDDHCRMDLVGKAGFTEMELNDNAKLSLDGLSIDSLWLRMTDHSTASLLKANHITGKLKDNSSLNIANPVISNNARTSNQAVIIIGKK